MRESFGLSGGHDGVGLGPDAMALYSFRKQSSCNSMGPGLFRSTFSVNPLNSIPPTVMPEFVDGERLVLQYDSAV